MRSSQKSGRSRGKGNRANKSQGHSPNRVYESAGPEGKVRGTPQQIIDKYQALARDAQLSGDRVASENFLQHAEHYSRILIAAAEAAAERRDQHQGGGQGQPQHQNGQAHQPPQGGGQPQDADPRTAAPTEPADQPDSDGLAAIETADGGSELVETPESRSKQRPARRPRPKRQNVEEEGAAEGGEQAPAERAPRRSKKSVETEGGDEPAEAAE